MLNETQRATLRAVCDTVVPRIERDEDPAGMWARTAGDVGVPDMIEEALAGLPGEQQAGMRELLDGIAAQGFPRLSQASREQILRNVGLLGTQAAAGVGALIGMTLFFS